MQPGMVPDALKGISPFVQRAHEVEPKDAFMSYQCKLYAAHLGQQCLEHEESPEAEAFLLAILDGLERDKENLREHSAMASEKAACAHILDFALKVYLAADDEDRQARPSK